MIKVNFRTNVLMPYYLNDMEGVLFALEGSSFKLTYIRPTPLILLMGYLKENNMFGDSFTVHIWN